MKKILFILFTLFSFLLSAQAPIKLTSIEQSPDTGMVTITKDTLGKKLQRYAEPRWLEYALPRRNVSIDADNHNFVISNGNIGSFATDTSSNGWILQYYVSKALADGVGKIGGRNYLTGKNYGLDFNGATGTVLSGNVSLTLANEQVQDGELDADSVYVATVNEAGVVDYVEKSTVGTWLKPQLEAGQQVLINTNTNFRLTSTSNYLGQYSANGTSHSGGGYYSTSQASGYNFDQSEESPFVQGSLNFTGLDYSKHTVNEDDEIVSFSELDYNVDDDANELPTLGSLSVNSEFLEDGATAQKRVDFTVNAYAGMNAAESAVQSFKVFKNAAQAGLDGISIIQFSGLAANTTNAPKLVLSRSNLTTPGSTSWNTTFASNNTVLGEINYSTNQNNSFYSSAKIVATTTEQHTASALGSKLELSTTPNGTASQVVRVSISQNGDITQSAYPNTRDDSGLAANLISTSSGGLVQSRATAKVFPMFSAQNTNVTFTGGGTLQNVGNLTQEVNQNTSVYSTTATTITFLAAGTYQINMSGVIVSDDVITSADTYQVTFSQTGSFAPVLYEGANAFPVNAANSVYFNQSYTVSVSANATFTPRFLSNTATDAGTLGFTITITKVN